MTTVTLDVLGGAPISRTTSGHNVTRMALVEGVTGAPHARPYNALNAPGLPAYGSAHPTVPGVFLLDQQVNPVPDSPDKFSVAMTYRVPTARDEALIDSSLEYGRATIEIDAGVTEEETSKDANGDRMRVEFRGDYLRQSFSDGAPTSIPTTIVYSWSSPVAVVSRPLLILRVKRWERNDPETVARELSGSVNAIAWRGYAAKTLLCTAVRVTQAPIGGFDVEYELLYNKADWIFAATTRISGYELPEAVPGNGVGFFDVYPVYDLSKLRVTT